MKKFFAILTVMCMVLTTLVIPVTVFADEGDGSDEEPMIQIYADEACSSDPIHDIYADKSQDAENTYFYVKYPAGATLEYKAGSRHMVTIEADDEGEGGESHTVWRMESTDGSISYYKDGENYEQIESTDSDYTGIEGAFTGSSTASGSVVGDSILDYIQVEDVTDSNAGYSLAKVSLKANANDPDDLNDDNEFRGSEDFLFMFSLTNETGTERTLLINYGIEIEYDPSAINDLDAAANAFYGLWDNIEEEHSDITEIGMSNGNKTVLLSNLGSLSTGRADLRHGIGSDIWLDLNNGYQITGIYDTVTGGELPYTASLVSYFRVYDSTGTEIKIEEIQDEDDCWGGMSTIGSPEEGKEDEIIASAYTTEQTLAKGTATNTWTDSDENWNGFAAGEENTGDFYAWCEGKGYTSELMATHLLYKIYMPVENKCKIKIETAPASNIGSFANASSDTSVRYSGVINNFESSEIELSDEDKEAVNQKLENYYNDEVELIDVYEFEGTIAGSANMAIPIENADNHEIVWLSETESEDDEENISTEFNPVPMLSVETSDNGAKVVPLGHFSKYAVVGNPNASNNSGGTTDSGSGGSTDSNTAAGSGTAASDKTSDTGDDFNIAPFIAAMAIALAGIAVAMVRRRNAR